MLRRGSCACPKAQPGTQEIHGPRTGLLTSALPPSSGSRAAELSNHQIYILLERSWNCHVSEKNYFDGLRLWTPSNFLRKPVTSSKQHIHAVNSAQKAAH